MFSLQVVPIISTFTRSSISSSQRCLFHPSPSCLCFSHPPSLLFFFKDPDSYSSIHFIDGKFLHSFPSMFLSGDSHEDSNGASSSSFLVLFFSGGFNSSFGIKHTPFLFFQCFSYADAPHIHSLLAICYSGVLKISRRFVFPLCIRSRSFEDVLSFKSFISTGALSFFKLFNGVSFEWALTHRSFPRIFPGSSNSPGAILKNSFRSFDVRMNCHQSNVLL